MAGLFGFLPLKYSFIGDNDRPVVSECKCEDVMMMPALIYLQANFAFCPLAEDIKILVWGGE